MDLLPHNHATPAIALEFFSSARNPSPPPPMATPLFHLHPWRPCRGRSQVSSPTTRTGCQALLVACVKGFNLVPLVFYQGRAGRHRHVADPHLTLQRYSLAKQATGEASLVWIVQVPCRNLWIDGEVRAAVQAGS